MVENTFAPDDRETPAVRINDGVDYVVMPQWKLFLVQLLNIAGLGPIFRSYAGSIMGTSCIFMDYIWYHFAGGVHDYFQVCCLNEMTEHPFRKCGNLSWKCDEECHACFSVVLLVMVGTVFAVGPAGLIVTLLGNKGVTGVLQMQKYGCGSFLHITLLQHLFLLIRLSDVFIRFLVFV